MSTHWQCPVHVCTGPVSDGVCLIMQRSLVFFHYMEVRWAPQCSMSITVAEETSSGEHKVKVTSLIVSDDYRDQSHVYSLRESAVATDQHGITGRRLLVDV